MARCLTRYLTLLMLLWLGAGSTFGVEPVIHGQVIDESGSGLAAVRIVLRPMSSRFEAGSRLLAGSADAPPVRITATGVDGGFRIVAPDAGVYELVAEAVGRVPAIWRPLVVTAPKQLPPWLLPSDRGLWVEVRTPTGRPVAKARIIARSLASWPRQAASNGWYPEVRAGYTDDRGGLRLPRASGEALHLVVNDGRHLAYAEVPAGLDSQAVTLTTQPSQRIEIRTAQGTPFEGVLVSSGDGNWPMALTAPSGELVLAPAARSLRLATSDGRIASLELQPESSGGLPVTWTAPKARFLDGQVIDAGSRRPITGALVWSTLDPGRPVRSDHHGRFRLLAQAVGEPSLRAASPGYLQAEYLTAAGQPTRSRPPIELRLQRARTLSGTVSNASGRPIRGALIRLLDPEAVPADAPRQVSTDSSGRFQIGQISPAGRLRLQVSASGFVPQQLSGILPLAKPLHLILQASRRLHGKVTDDLDRPIAGAAVAATWRPLGESSPLAAVGERRTSTVTGQAGRFEIDTLGAGQLTLTATAGGFVPTELPPKTVGTDEPYEVIIVLERGAVIEGRVETADGMPVADAEILAGNVAALSAADGGYRLEPVAAQLQEIELSHSGLGHHSQELWLEPGVQRLDWHLPTGVGISGRTVDPGGHPVAEVILELRRIDAAFAGEATIGRSSADGDFRLAPLAPGRYELRARRAGFVTRQVGQGIEVGTDDVDGLAVVLEGGGVIFGQIAGLARGHLQQVQIEAADAAGTLWSATSDAGGWFEVHDLPPGPWHLRAIAGDGRWQARAELVLPPGVERLRQDLEFELGAMLTGTLRFESKLLSGARIAVIAEGSGHRHSVRTTADGAFRIENLAAGRYLLEATHVGQLLVHQQQLWLDGDLYLPLEISAAPVTGWVVSDAYGVPIPGVLVSLLRLGREGGDQLRITGSTDSDGTFTLPRVPPGIFRYRVSKPGWVAAEGTTEIAASGRHGLELRLARQDS